MEEERMKAEEAAKAAKEKLVAAETAAKNAAEQAKDRVRQLKTSIGLKGTVGPKVDPLVSHRGKGAFTLEEFLNRATEWSGLALDNEERPKASLTAPEVDELVKASATPASNQNIPEFLKKAAAWSGLNPETYLQTQEEKKSSPPPKVAAKPPKPLPTSVVNEPSLGAEVSQGDEKVPQKGGEGAEVAEKKEDEGKVEEKVEDSEGPQVTGEVSLGESVSNDGSQVSDVVKGDVDEKEEGDNEGSQVTPVNKEETQVEAADKEELKVEEADDKAVDNTDGCEVAVLDSEKSDAVLDNDGEAQTEGSVEGESNVKKGECQDEKSSGESKSECEDEALGGDEDGSVGVKAADNESPPKEEGGDSKEPAVSDENSSEVKQSENPEIVPEVANSESNEAGDGSGKDEAGDKSESGDAGDESEAQQSQPNDTCSDVNNEEAHVNNGESEVNNTKLEVDGGEPEVNNEEKKPINENDGMKEESAAVDESNEENKNGNLEPVESKDVPGDKNNIIENGLSVEEMELPAENEHLNNGDTKSVLPEKCGKPVENSSAQNVGTVNS